MTSRDVWNVAARVMTPRQWKAFTLIYVEEVSYAQAGRLMGIDPRAVQRLVERGLRRVREEAGEQAAR